MVTMGCDLQSLHWRRLLFTIKHLLKIIHKEIKQKQKNLWYINNNDDHDNNNNNNNNTGDYIIVWSIFVVIKY